MKILADLANILSFVAAAAVAQWVRAQVKGLVFESQLRRTLVVKTGSHSNAGQ